MGDDANKQRFELAKADAQDALDAMGTEFQTAWEGGTSPPVPTPVPPDPTPGPTPTGAAMGKQQTIENQGMRHTFGVDDRGRLIEFYGEHQEAANALDGDYEPLCDVSIARVYPGPPDNPFFTWYTVTGWHKGYAGMRMMRWWGKAFGAEADHWEGPFMTDVPA